MPARKCFVSYRGPEPSTHLVQVEAESLFEAVALAVMTLRQITTVSENAEFTVTMGADEHQTSYGRIQQWLNGPNKGPADFIKRQKVRTMLGLPESKTVN